MTKCLASQPNYPEMPFLCDTTPADLYTEHYNTHMLLSELTSIVAVARVCEKETSAYSNHNQTNLRCLFIDRILCLCEIHETL